MSTFITRYDTSGDGVRLAVKDLIDLEGELTTAGCKAVADRATPAAADAALIAGARAAGARIVGKTNLTELAYDATGANQWFGTPVNPLDPGRVCGGSSSGSAVAVATGEADVAYGSDTGGSIRMPAACCGIVGLKTTWGRVPLDGVWKLAESLDTVGPMATTVAGVVQGMALLEPGFAAAEVPAATIGRLRIEGTDPAVDEAIDQALAASGLQVIEVVLDGWSTAASAFVTIICAEAWENDRHLLDGDREGVSEKIAGRVAFGASITPEALAEGRAAQDRWRAEVTAALGQAQVLALPTLLGFAPTLDQVDQVDLTHCTHPFNVSLSPALSLPVPSSGALPASLQLVGPDGGEELLCATASAIEAAAKGR
jgi:amidase